MVFAQKNASQPRRVFDCVGIRRRDRQEASMPTTVTKASPTSPVEPAPPEARPGTSAGSRWMPTGASSCSSSLPRGSASQHCRAIPWGRIGHWFGHVPWEGSVFWDMIQPGFIFMVGVAMPFALARRRELGATERDNLRHVLVRSIRLIILSQIIIWGGAVAEVTAAI